MQYADSGQGPVDYVDEAQIYEDEHGNSHRHDDEDDGYDYDDSEGYGQGSKEYYQHHNGGHNSRHDEQGEMW